MGLTHRDFTVGRNTGRDEFPAHIQTLGKFGRLNDFLVVLDGDSRHMEATIKDVAGEYGRAVRPLFLPGEQPPEHWLWESLLRASDEYAPILGLSATHLTERMAAIEQTLEGAVRRRRVSAKTQLEMLAHDVERTPPDIARIVARQEASNESFALRELVDGLAAAIDDWRKLR